MWHIMIMLTAILASSSAFAEKWSYEGYKTSQGEWHELSPDYAKCMKGTNQSPIAIDRTTLTKLPPLQFEYEATPTHFTYDRYTVVVTPREGLSLTEGEKRYPLKEMMMRTPSEHEVLNEFYPMELQLIHDMPDEKRLVVSIFVTIGTAHPALQTIIDHFPSSSKEKKSALFDWQALLPQEHGFYSYSGSQSYPPCTENTEYRILKKPIEASKEQLTFLLNDFQRNSRNVQPVMMRTILESTED